MSKLTVKAWIKATGIACLVELLFVAGFATMQLANVKTLSDSILMYLTLYHMFAISLTFTVLNIIWGWPGIGREPIRTPTALAYVLVCVFQVILTIPIVYGLLRWINYARQRRSPKVTFRPPTDR